MQQQRAMQCYGEAAAAAVERMAGEGAVVVFSISTCCMCHAVKRLFCGMGVHPTVYELDRLPSGRDIHRALADLLLVSSPSPPPSSSSDAAAAPSLLPVVFVGGKLVGAMDSVMASHINGTLVPLLKEAGALWL